jgi:glycosyltransferase involved in cell wall biosynthesis
MLKVLLIGIADGEDVGEAWLGFQWAKRLAARHEVTILTYYKRGRNPLSRQLPGVRVVEWPEPALVGKAERLNSLLKPGWVPFYVHARRWIRERLAAGERFDVAYQINPVAIRYPSPAVGFGIPYVIGPVGGSLSSPPGFVIDEDTAPWYVQLRRLDQFRLRADPWLRKTYAQASCVIGIAPYVKDVLADIPLRRFEAMSDFGIDSLPVAADRTIRDSRDIRLLFVGRVIRTKGVRDALSALSLVKALPVVFDVVGDGFDRAACEALSADLGLGDRVRFHGRMDRSLVDDFYRAADVFVFPSYREPGGLAVHEAMAHGLPVIVANVGGPAAAVDDTSGIRVPPHSPDQYAADIARAITRLATDRKLRLALGEGARRRVAETLLWEHKVTRLEEIWADALAEHGRQQAVNR